MSFLLSNMTGAILAGINAMAVLLVLKTIGYILLIILLVIVALIVCVLFVPVRYQGKGNVEEMSCQFRIQWLLQLVKFQFSYENEKGDYALYLFGIRTKILDKDAMERRKRRKERRKAKKAAKKYKSRKKKYQREHDKYKEQYLRQNEDAPIPEADFVHKESIEFEFTGSSNNTTNTQDSNDPLKGAKKVVQMVKKGWYIIQTIQTYRPFQLIWPDLQKLLYRARPRVLKGEILFGFNDPAMTGQVVGMISNLYFLYQYDKLQICPDFESEEAYLKGHINGKGYVQGIYVIIFSIRIMRKKMFRRFLKALDL